MNKLLSNMIFDNSITRVRLIKNETNNFDSNGPDESFYKDKEYK